MIKHIVFYKLKDYSVENCEKLIEVFHSMRGKVELAQDVNAHMDFLSSARSFHVVLEVNFESKEAMALYQQDPYHVDCVKKYVHSVVCESASVDYIF